MKIQADIPKELNQHLKMYKIKNDFLTLQDALIDILCEFFKQPKKDYKNFKEEDVK